ERAPANHARDRRDERGDRKDPDAGAEREVREGEDADGTRASAFRAGVGGRCSADRSVSDPDHSIGESRYVTIVLPRNDDRIRIISARTTTASERRIYEQGD